MSATIQQLDPPLPVVTPRGTALCHVLIYEGQEHHVRFVCFMDADGTCWVFENPDVKLQWNKTMGRVPDPARRWKLPGES